MYPTTEYLIFAQYGNCSTGFGVGLGFRVLREHMNIEYLDPHDQGKASRSCANCGDLTRP